MRSVTFVDRLTLEVEGTVAQNAVCLGEVAGRGEGCLVVGTGAGLLMVFRGPSTSPWLVARELGFITAVAVGDLLGLGRPVLVVASGCGWVHVFDCSMEEEAVEGEPRVVTPLHTQRIPANVKDMILCDVVGRGEVELVVSLTDRVVRTYRWQRAEGEEAGRLVSVNKWEFASQIGTVTCNTDTDGRPALLVAQPGGAFMKIRCEGGEGEEPTAPPEPQYEPLGVNRRRNRNVSAEILGGFHSREGGPATRYAIVTLDGTVLLVDQGTRDPMDSIMWNLQVDHQLMCLSQLDVTGDGVEEVIACSWDGQTYIISQDRQAVRFQFEESVSTFTAGRFGLEAGSSTPALVYVTFTGTIQVYYNLGLDRGITLSSLVHCPGMVEEAADLLRSLGADPADMRQLQQVAAIQG